MIKNDEWYERAKTKLGFLLLERDHMASLANEAKEDLDKANKELKEIKQQNHNLIALTQQWDQLHQTNCSDISKLKADLKAARSANVVDQLRGADIQSLKHMFDRLTPGERDNIGRALQACDMPKDPVSAQAALEITQ